MGHSVEVMAGTYLHTDDERGAAAGELISGVLDGDRCECIGEGAYGGLLERER